MSKNRFSFHEPGSFDGCLDLCPNPKPNIRDKKGFGSLVNLYTAFSVDFCEYALDVAQGFGAKRILDPFCGMGSLGEAARERALHLTVNDLNPFAVLATRFRTSDMSDLEKGELLLQQAFRARPSIAEDPFPKAARSLAQVASIKTAHLVDSPNDWRGRAAAVALFLLCVARIRLNKAQLGTNPTWTKNLDESALNTADIRKELKDVVNSAMRFLQGLAPVAEGWDINSFQTPVSELTLRKSSVDAIITSPPYPNRIDYYRHYLAATDFLTRITDQSERDLREIQIGTPLIRPEMPHPNFPAGIQKLIRSVREHKSYASESYYWKGYQYYFADMDIAFSRMSQWLKPGGICIFVVQDAFYKDIFIPVAELLVDLARPHGFKLREIKTWPVRNRLATMSPHVKRSNQNRQPDESVVLLSK